MSNIFNFHGSASGVFGSNNDVQGNKFTSGEVPSHLIEKVLIAAAQLRTNVPQEQAAQIDEAALDVRDGIDDPDRLGRGAQRLARIATAVGEIGGPLLKAATDVMSALPG